MSLPEFINFKIERIITHEVFQRNESREIIPPIMSEQLTFLDDDGKDELAVRIVEAVGKDSKSIEMDIVKTGSNSVNDYVNQIFTHANDSTFIEMSKNITLSLAEAQTSRNFPGGILVVINGTTSLNGNKYIAIIKAELQGGFQKRSDKTIAYVKDLLLTPQQKLYKIGIFLESKNYKHRAFVYDFNMSKSQENGMAAYFYEQFLGCTISHTDKYLTNMFYHETKNFIDKSGHYNDEEVFDLHTHLYSYLKSDIGTVSVTEFSNLYISDTKKKDSFNNYMQNKIGEDVFSRSISKDISDIKTKLRIRKVTFSNNVKISAPSDEFENNVQIIDEFEREGRVITSIEIAGKINGLDN
jgi:hypothetical protein